MSLSNKLNKKRDALAGILLIGPAIFFIGLTIIYPVIYGIGLSFSSKHLLRPTADFVGLENYTYLLKSGSLLEAMKHSFVWTFFSVIMSEFIGFWVALLLNMNLKGRGVFRGLILIPWVIAPVVTGYLWLWLANDMYGVLNYFLQLFGIIDKPIFWFGNSKTALISLILVNVWKSFPFISVVILAGLQSISPELYEAAKIDGASRFQEIRFITLPRLKHIINITLLLMSIWNFNHFDLLWVITEGGPGTATTTLPILAYRTGFKSMRLGEATAITVIMFIITLIISIIYMTYLTKIEPD